MRKKILSRHRTQAKNLFSHMKNAEPAFFCCKKGEEMNWRESIHTNDVNTGHLCINL